MTTDRPYRITIFALSVAAGWLLLLNLEYRDQTREVKKQAIQKTDQKTEVTMFNDGSAGWIPKMPKSQTTILAIPIYWMGVCDGYKNGKAGYSYRSNQVLYDAQVDLMDSIFLGTNGSTVTLQSSGGGETNTLESLNFQITQPTKVHESWVFIPAGRDQKAKSNDLANLDELQDDGPIEVFRPAVTNGGGK